MPRFVLLLLAFLKLGNTIISQSLPEESMTTPEIISYYGYSVEIITATTDDGYVLEMHRIPFGRNESRLSSGGARPVVFLQHGLLASSADWVSNLPNQSLGFLLADRGFDVWMGNSRGNVYSCRHNVFPSHSEQYWNFTWDEIALHDVETQINRALKVSGQQNLFYVGHSQGTLVMFAKLASDPSFASKIRRFFALAPVASVGHIQGLIRITADHFIGEFKWWLRMVGEHEFLPSTWVSRLVSKVICGVVSAMNPLCTNVMFQIGGPEAKQFNKTRLMVYMSHTPAGTSTSNILHWAQMVRSGKTQMFDYGSEEKNIWKYGQATPPLYNLSRISAPIHLFYSDSDWLADARDVEGALLPVLPKASLQSVSKLVDFNHFDFIYGLRAPEEIYEKIIAEMAKDELLTSNKVRN